MPVYTTDPCRRNIEPTVDQRLAYEAELHSLVNGHPHAVTFHGAGFDTDTTITQSPRPLYFLDLYEGGTLVELLDQPYLWKRDDRAQSVLLHIVDAVAHCHVKGVAHRDIKAENVLLSGSDFQTAVLADFGLAHGGLRATKHGIGSQQYIAPEVIGEHGHAYNPREAMSGRSVYSARRPLAM
ncbi:kinase-like domain-containing protein [Amylostereum chailletii]|nr:kinase-like domain-containing protein [Amylostereum chailletii]